MFEPSTPPGNTELHLPKSRWRLIYSCMLCCTPLAPVLHLYPVARIVAGYPITLVVVDSTSRPIAGCKKLCPPCHPGKYEVNANNNFDGLKNRINNRHWLDSLSATLPTTTLPIITCWWLSYLTMVLSGTDGATGDLHPTCPRFKLHYKC